MSNIADAPNRLTGGDWHQRACTLPETPFSLHKTTDVPVPVGAGPRVVGSSERQPLMSRSVDLDQALVQHLPAIAGNATTQRKMFRPERRIAADISWILLRNQKHKTRETLIFQNEFGCREARIQRFRSATVSGLPCVRVWTPQQSTSWALYRSRP